jgi:metal-responsive CopG/Arc/MetJ family transcriptional regulator
MRVKTSVTLPGALLAEIDRLDSNRSAFLERAAIAYLARASKAQRDAKDAAIFDRIAGQLSEESDAIEYQGLPE